MSSSTAPSVITKSTPVSIGIVALLGGMLLGGIFYANDIQTTLTGFTATFDATLGPIKEDVREIKTSIAKQGEQLAETQVTVRLVPRIEARLDSLERREAALGQKELLLEAKIEALQKRLEALESK